MIGEKMNGNREIRTDIRRMHERRRMHQSGSGFSATRANESQARADISEHDVRLTRRRLVPDRLRV